MQWQREEILSLPLLGTEPWLSSSNFYAPKIIFLIPLMKILLYFEPITRILHLSKVT
jgi:hypothetical protein